ncbi:MAG: DegT/DnrJ/EryC1/StrS family aminotransferase, partial [Spirochaetes bacterium]|nr:DegT/DnrJ/EryC1/StrS family aminotransferase [Spirochaetota bacterium]
MKVPFLNLKAQYLSVKDEMDTDIQNVIDNTAFAGGKFVKKFEDEFAAYCDCKYSIGVGSGTDALWLALIALGIGSGDEVITTPNTFIATTEAISISGAKPVFVDVIDNTYSMDPNQIESVITNKTKAIIPVHIFGQVCDMDPILEIAKKHNLYVIEDACQAHGAEYKGKKAGSMGDVAAFSFYPGKNLGAFGEAGGIVTSHEELYTKMQIFKDHGQAKKYYHDIVGWNARMDGIQGAVLSVKLKHIDNWNESRRVNAGLYNKLLADISEIQLPVEADYSKHIYHIYAIRVKERDALMKYLQEAEIGCGIHYPVPIHKQKAYQEYNSLVGKFPVAEQSADEFLSLPMFPELSEEEIVYVVNKI